MNSMNHMHTAIISIEINSFIADSKNHFNNTLAVLESNRKKTNALIAIKKCLLRKIDEIEDLFCAYEVSKLELDDQAYLHALIAQMQTDMEDKIHNSNSVMVWMEMLDNLIMNICSKADEYLSNSYVSAEDKEILCEYKASFQSTHEFYKCIFMQMTEMREGALVYVEELEKIRIQVN